MGFSVTEGGALRRRICDHLPGSGDRDHRAIGSPPMQLTPRPNQSPHSSPKANPVPATDPKADPVAALDPKADPAPATDLKADYGSPAQEWTRSSRNWTQHLYTEVDLGGVYQQQNTTLYQSTGNPLTATFNLGIRGNVALGYDINKSLAVEFDTGVLWNSMDKVGGTSLDSIGQSFDTYTIPFLATVIYRIQTKGSWYPYMGIGVGGAAAIASYNLGTTGGFTSPTFTDCNFVFAYQAEAGMEFKFTKNFSADIAYQFLGTTDPTWKFTNPAGPGGIPPATQYTFTEKGFYTHSFVLSLTWHF